MSITVYTTHCPSCRVLEEKLKKKNIEYTTIDDRESVVAKGIELGITSAPILQVDDKYYKFTDAIKWVGEYNEH